jgi:RNA polymerase sigma factor (sigma-70 family)
MLSQAMDTLKPELRIVIQKTYYEDKSQQEIAGELNISQMQVSRRIRKALDLLSVCLKELASRQAN